MVKLKKRILISSGVVSMLIILAGKIGVFPLCGGYEYGMCVDVLFYSLINLFPIIPLFIFSLITYKMKDEIFRLWWFFARVWIPLAMLAILIAPAYSSNFIFPIAKGTVSFVFLAFFVLISTVLIIYQSFNLRKRER